MKVGILNIGGNTASVWYAVERLGHKASLISEVGLQDALIIPGQGRFDVGLSKISKAARDAIFNFTGPVIGICLGMQLLCEESEEGGGKGLGIFDGKLIKLPSTATVPHIGWSKCSDGNYYYFAHSYHLPANGQNWKELVCSHGEISFVASGRKGNFIGAQFHPEKSGKAGHEFLKQALEC